jgi:acetylornithine/N-succinyldiaminopimelate aminotransferase
LQLQAITGRGYMIGLLLQGEPAPYITALREAGLLAVAAGTSTVRLLPPLIATREQLDRATAMIRTVLVKKSQPPPT